MAETKRVIIGSETDDSKKIDLQTSGLINTVPVSLYDTSGNQINLAAGLVSGKYDSINLTYDASNNLTIVIYKLGTAIVNTLTLSYDANNNLTKVIRT